MEYKTGDVLVAISECIMQPSGKKALIIGKEYKIIYDSENSFGIVDENNIVHDFSFEQAHEYFKPKPKLEIGSKCILKYIHTIECRITCIDEKNKIAYVTTWGKESFPVPLSEIE